MNPIVEMVVIAAIGLIVAVLVYRFMVIKLTHPDDSWMQDLLNDLELKPEHTMTIEISAADLALLNAGQPVTLVGPTVITPPQPSNKLKVIIAQNGATPLWLQDYSYPSGIVITKNSPGGNGNPNCIKVVTPTWGGFQPSNDNGVVTDFSACSTITVDVNAPKGSQFSVQFLRGGDLPIAGVSGNHFTKAVDGWETITFPAKQLMTDSALGNVQASIYKGAVESQNNVPTFTYEVDNWGGY